MFHLIPLFTIVFLAYGRADDILEVEERIVGGETTTISMHPYQVSLIVSGNHNCGGTLIRPNVVLTAAHCVENLRPRQISVRAGSSKRNQGGVLVGVKKICTHLKYTPFDYDVSVLLLNQSFKLSDSINIIPIQDVGHDVPPGTLATVTGWGTVSARNTVYPSDLQIIDVLPKMSNKQCAAAYPNEDITSRMSCYAVKGGRKDACQGDSGGPLVANGKVAGIVSWGYGCAAPKFPGVYTDLANKEINQHIKSCLAKFSKRTI